MIDMPVMLHPDILPEMKTLGHGDDPTITHGDGQNNYRSCSHGGDQNKTLCHRDDHNKNTVIKLTKLVLVYTSIA